MIITPPRSIGRATIWRWGGATTAIFMADLFASGADTNDTLFRVSAGCKFDFGLAVDLGRRIADEDYFETQTMGLLPAYKIAL